jgi:hypothetical protein
MRIEKKDLMKTKRERLCARKKSERNNLKSHENRDLVEERKKSS